MRRRELLTGAAALAAFGGLPAEAAMNYGPRRALLVTKVASIGPVGPKAVILPTPPFGSSNLVAWYDVAATYIDSNGVAQPSVFYDTVGHNSVSGLLDLAGNGNDFFAGSGAATTPAGDKAFQPDKSINGGPYFSVATQSLDCVNGSMLNGLSQISIYALLRPDIPLGGVKRTLLYVSEGFTSGSLISATVANGGTGHAVGDYIPFSGGTASTQAIVKVAAVSSGVITGITLINPGAYTVFPASPVSQGTSTGAGTGATFNAVFTTIGGSTAAERLTAYLSAGTTGRKPYITSSALDGAANTTSTSANKSVGLLNTGALNDTVTKVRQGWEIDYTGGTASMAAYQNGVLDTTQTWTPAETAPWTLGTADSKLIRLGNNNTPNSALGMEIVALIILSEIPSSGRRALIDASWAGR